MQLFTTSNFIGPWYHADLLFSGLGSIVLLFALLFSQQIREDPVRAACSCHFQIVTKIIKGTMSAGAHALSSPVGRFLRGVFLRRFV